MAAPAWPSSLPTQFLHGTYEEALPDGRIRTDMEVGPAKVRRRTTAAPRPMKGQMTLDNSQMGALSTFWTTDTVYGSRAFTMTHPWFGNTVLVRFVEAPSWTRIGDHVQVTFDLEVLP
jgi:hypothetical protein